MSSVPTSAPTLDEAARRRFEAAWREGRPRPIEQFLPAPGDSHFLATLEELVLIELELAWKSWSATQGAGDASPATVQRPPLVEDYLTRFPTLDRPEVVRRLLEQEYRVRRRWGDRPAADDYHGRFPSLPLTLHDAVPSPTVAELPTIPGYELLEELGRGGMGVVYKARQLGLNRLVALKMILTGPFTSSGGLARFRVEAEAIAALQHPNIVQIHEIGECAGAPYFALEYVEGGTLAQQLGGAPQPARQAAEMVETLARAVESAHRRGVIHRDLKPANVLLAAEGTPKVADFGLAKRLEDGAGQTRTGEVVGTPSYMAPEQAAGRQNEVGPACDVYALGAILYEMLTGRPPFRAESSLETLQQVLVDDPVPPRRLQPRTPRDLDWIALKCLRKKPRDRYATAGALADDLRHLLNHEPVRARPAPAWERAVKWARRRPAAAALLLAAVLAVLGLLAGAGWHEAQLRAERDATARQRDEADRQKKDAQTQREKAEQQKTEAENQKKNARDHFEKAWAAVDEMVETAKRLEDIPKAETLRNELLTKALAFYDGLLKVDDSDPKKRQEAARAYRSKGDIENLLAHSQQAEDAYHHAADLQQALVDQFPANADYRYDLAMTWNSLATLLQINGRPDAEVEAAYQTALKWDDPLLVAFPDRADYRQGTAAVLNNLGELRYRQERYEDALEAHERALKLRKQSFEASPDNPAYRKELAFSYSNRGRVSRNLGRLAAKDSKWVTAYQDYYKAEDDFRQVLDAVIPDDDQRPEDRRVRAAAYGNLALVLKDEGNRDAEALAARRQVVEIRKKLFDEFPNRLDYRRELAIGYGDRGLSLQGAEADCDFRRAASMQRELCDQHPDVPQYLDDLDTTLRNLADFHMNRSEPAQALEPLTDAIHRLQAAPKEVRERLKVPERVRSHQAWLAEALVRLKRHAEAVQAAEELPRILPEGPEEYYRAAWLISRCIPIAEDDDDLPDGKRQEIVEKYAAEAMALLQQAISRGFKDADVLKSNADFAPLRRRAPVEFKKLLDQLEPPS